MVHLPCLSFTVYLHSVSLPVHAECWRCLAGARIAPVVTSSYLLIHPVQFSSGRAFFSFLSPNFNLISLQYLDAPVPRLALPPACIIFCLFSHWLHHSLAIASLASKFEVFFILRPAVG